MNNALRIWLFGGLLTLFGLFAVYSTSIWKSFDQRLTVNVMQNIETVKAFNTFLDETIISSTQKLLTKHVPVVSSFTWTAESVQTGVVAEVAQIGEVQDAASLLPTLDTLKSDGQEQVQLVAQGKKSIQLRNNYVLFSSQIKNLIIGLFAMLSVLFLPLAWFKEKKFIFTVAIAVVLLQICVFIPGIAATNGEARGRVDFKVIPNIQPAEFFKLGYVFFMAYWLTKRKEFVNSQKFLLQFAVINALVLLVILAIPDFWTLFILALTGTIMARYSGLKAKKIWMLWGAAIVVAMLGISFISLVNPKNYAFSRLTTFLERDPEARKEIELREGRQIQQGLVAIGAGGLFGQGYGKGLQKMGQLPEAYSDMIFSAFSEEIWFFWNLVLFGLYIGLFISVLARLSQIRDPQLRALAVGIVSLIIVQVFVHVGVNLDILPNTGLTLPFVSHGGTALMINLIELALLYKILRGK